MPNLTARKVETIREPGMHGDGGGLYLRVGPTGAKSWIVRTRISGRLTASGTPLRWEGGLGSSSLVSLAEARDQARELRRIARAGGDPSVARKAEALTFRETARRVHEALKPTWRSEKHARLWWDAMENHVLLKLGARPIAALGAADVLDVLAPLWTGKHETASRLRQRIAAVFDWAKGAGHYPHENPVNRLKKALPMVKRWPDHMGAMPWGDVPAFMAELAGREGVSARTLEFVILTAARSGEARGARWAELDLKAGVWTVPGERMKGGLPHRVPLSPQALAVLERVKGLDGDLVFPSATPGPKGEPRAQSEAVVGQLCKRMKREGFTTHGFRSSFRD